MRRFSLKSLVGVGLSLGLVFGGISAPLAFAETPDEGEQVVNAQPAETVESIAPAETTAPVEPAVPVETTVPVVETDPVGTVAPAVEEPVSVEPVGVVEPVETVAPDLVDLPLLVSEPAAAAVDVPVVLAASRPIMAKGKIVGAPSNDEEYYFLSVCYPGYEGEYDDYCSRVETARDGSYSFDVRPDAESGWNGTDDFDFYFVLSIDEYEYSVSVDFGTYSSSDAVDGVVMITDTKWPDAEITGRVIDPTGDGVDYVWICVYGLKAWGVEWSSCSHDPVTFSRFLCLLGPSSL